MIRVMTVPFGLLKKAWINLIWTIWTYISYIGLVKINSSIPGVPWKSYMKKVA